LHIKAKKYAVHLSDESTRCPFPMNRLCSTCRLTNSGRFVGNTETMRLPFPIHLKGVFGIPPKTHSANPLDVPGRDFTRCRRFAEQETGLAAIFGSAYFRCQQTKRNISISLATLRQRPDAQPARCCGSCGKNSGGSCLLLSAATRSQNLKFAQQRSGSSSLYVAAIAEAHARLGNTDKALGIGSCVRHQPSDMFRRVICRCSTRHREIWMRHSHG